jgi:hypothetical protein
MNQVSQPKKRSGPLVIAVLALLLLILHQDYWLWDNKTLVFDILPIGLFWHICISLAATFLWYLATQIAWPLREEDRIGGTKAPAQEDRS